MENVPRHIGIILDGNRRFAKRLMLKPWKGHEWGAKKFRTFVGWCNELGVEEITAYVFSIQNFNRPKEEFDYLMGVFKKEFEHLLSQEEQAKLKKNDTRISFIGRLWMLPEEIKQLQKQLMETTKNHKTRNLNFAMAYGGREEIIDAIKQISTEIQQGKIQPDEITEETITKHLWLESQPDLIIRTGGEQRTSNFLPWQGTYSELMFIEKYWPEIEKEDLLACVQNYAERERRFGK